MSSLRPGPSPVDRTGGQPPTDEDWRQDARAQSRHSRLEDVLVEPLEDRDRERAAVVCGEITRRALRDFAPSVVLLPASERRRLQAVAAFSLTLFDFARQSGLEGEKLAQMNRWNFDLEATLGGDPPGQPVFVLLAAAAEDRPLSRDALEELVACARHRALHPRSASRTGAEKASLRLAGALVEALAPEGHPELATLAGALLRVGRLLALAEDRRRHQEGLGCDELPDDWAAEGPADDAGVAAAIRSECRDLRSALAAPPSLRELPPGWRRALTYALLAARRLLDSIEGDETALLESPPGLAVFVRLRLLLRSRWLPL